MPMTTFRQIRAAIEQLDPGEVRGTAERPVVIRLTASGAESYARMEAFLAPPTLSRAKRMDSLGSLYRDGEQGAPDRADIEIFEAGWPRPDGGFVFDGSRRMRLVEDILEAKQDLGLPLARAFPPFRRDVCDRIIFNISKENALLAIMTALPDLAPGLAIPWMIPEAATDAAVLTVNQIRMAFLLAAASDRQVGYREQKAEVASIIAGAFGWRALARELASKIPLGGGILPKAGIAFAGTFVEGRSLERLYRLGYSYTRSERKLAYGEAFARGREVAARLLDAARRRGPNPPRST